MSVGLLILLGLFVVCVLPALIQAGYNKIIEEVGYRKYRKKSYEKQRAVDEIKENPNNVQSNELIYFANGFYDISTDKFDYFLYEDGNKILGPYTKILNPFWGDDSLASVLIDDEVFYIDNQGNKVLGPFKEYKRRGHYYPKYKGNSFSVDYNACTNGYAILNVRRTNTFFDVSAKLIVNTKGEIIYIANRDDFVTGFSDGLMAIKEGNKVYFINENKEKILGPYEFSSFWPYHTKFSERLAVVCENGEFWYIDKTGMKVLGPYKRAYSFTKEGFACVITKDGVGCIDRQGKFIWGPSPEYYEMQYAPLDGCIVLSTLIGGNYSIIDVLNNKIVGTYKETTFMVNGHAFVKSINGEHLIVYKDGRTKRLEDMGYVFGNHFKYVQSTANGRYSVNLKNDSAKVFYSIDHNGNMLKMSDEVVEILKKTPNLKLAIKDNDDQNNQEVKESKEEFNPFIEAYIKTFPHASQDAYANECAEKNRIALLEHNKLQQSKEEYKKIQQSKVGQAECKIETQEYHVVGVQFDTYKKGCYYYFGDNRIYNLGDRVLVPTSNNGDKEATVVFRKIYKNKSEIPYNANLKTVIRKLDDNSAKTENYNNLRETNHDNIYGGWYDDMCVNVDDDICDSSYDDAYSFDYEEESRFDDGPWWDITKMSSPDDTDYE